MAAGLVELENHPGHRLLATVTPTGQTAERWSSARDILAGLWQDFGTYQAVVTAARTVRARRARPGDRELAELRHLLVEPSIEVSRTVVTLPERPLTGGAEHVEKITLDQLSARMDASFGTVAEVVVTCDALHQAFLTGLAPLAERVRAARELAGDLDLEGGDPAAAAVTTLAARVDELDRTCATDPLSLAGRPAGGAGGAGGDPASDRHAPAAGGARQAARTGSDRRPGPSCAAGLAAGAPRPVGCLGEPGWLASAGGGPGAATGRGRRRGWRDSRRLRASYRPAGPPRGAPGAVRGVSGQGHPARVRRAPRRPRPRHMHPAAVVDQAL